MATTTTEYRAIHAEIGCHGTYKASPAALDAAIRRFLPNSPNGLRKIVEERTASAFHDDGEYWGDVTTVTEFLFVLAETDFSEYTFDS